MNKSAILGVVILETFFYVWISFMVIGHPWWTVVWLAGNLFLVGIALVATGARGK